jgi:hypothetical protein
MVKNLVASMLTLALMGCGGGNANPTAPAPPVPTVSSIALALPDMIRVGQVEQATATANMSNGTTTSFSSGFRTDAPAVATVTDGGSVTGLSNGSAKIFLSYQGVQGTRLIRVVPDYQGTWTTRYSVTSCMDAGILRDAGGCRSFAPRVSAPLTLNLTQAQDGVTATITLGQHTANQTSGSIASDGSVSLDSVVPGGPARVDVAVRINQVIPEDLTGTVSLNWVATGTFPGNMQIAGVLTTSTRTAIRSATVGEPSSMLTVDLMLRSMLR